ncbi:hypothetical protein MNBD_GAMMA10-2569 [hydrothermal vent metagenome]|uniref:Uncharacterized protein n=1 Tax=hydrothermal vent metagenome TaxID=652676 RepID=A0A3B0XPQ3_9ZZZZ
MLNRVSRYNKYSTLLIKVILFSSLSTKLGLPLTISPVMHLSDNDKKLIEWFYPYTKYFLAFMLLLIIYLFGTVTYEKNLCASTCSSKGYFDSRYSPRGRFRKSECFCYTEEEASIKNKTMPGVKIDI